MNQHESANEENDGISKEHSFNLLIKNYVDMEYECAPSVEFIFSSKQREKCRIARSNFLTNVCNSIGDKIPQEFPETINQKSNPIKFTFK